MTIRSPSLSISPRHTAALSRTERHGCSMKFLHQVFQDLLSKSRKANLRSDGTTPIGTYPMASVRTWWRVLHTREVRDCPPNRPVFEAHLLEGWTLLAEVLEHVEGGEVSGEATPLEKYCRLVRQTLRPQRGHVFVLLEYLVRDSTERWDFAGRLCAPGQRSGTTRPGAGQTTRTERIEIRGSRGSVPVLHKDVMVQDMISGIYAQLEDIRERVECLEEGKSAREDSIEEMIDHIKMRLRIAALETGLGEIKSMLERQNVPEQKTGSD